MDGRFHADRARNSGEESGPPGDLLVSARYRRHDQDDPRTGPQAEDVGRGDAAFKTQLGPLLNGVVNFETWLPVKSMEFAGSMELLKKYQERAPAAGTDPLGYYMPV